MIEDKINELKRSLVEYSCHVVTMVEKSIQSLADRRERTIRDVLEKDEPRANDFEIDIDDTLFLSKRPPK